MFKRNNRSTFLVKERGSFKPWSVHSTYPRISDDRKLQSDSCVITGGIAYILKISRIFGMAPLRFEPHNKGFRISVSRPMCIYSYILVTCIASTTLLMKVLEVTLEDRKQDESKLTFLTFSYMNTMIAVIVLAAVFSGPKRMKNFIKHMNIIATVDRSFSTQYSRVIDIKIFVTALLMLILLIVLFIRDYFIFRRYNAKFFRTVSRFAYHATNFLMMNLYLQVSYTFVTVRARFQSVNDALELVTCQWSLELETIQPNAINICAICEDDSVIGRTPIIIVRSSITTYPRLQVSPSTALQRIAILRGSLCDIVNCLSNDCGLSIIITLLSTLGNFVVYLYFMIFYVSIAVGLWNKLKTPFNSGPWIVMHTVVMVSLIDPCHRTVLDDKKTRRILCNMMRLAPLSNTLLRTLELFSNQVMLKPASYEPLKMCTLNRRLMTTIVGAISTYLVILLQYSN